jgi:hypothetical protein
VRSTLPKIPESLRCGDHDVARGDEADAEGGGDRAGEEGREPGERGLVPDDPPLEVDEELGEAAHRLAGLVRASDRAADRLLHLAPLVGEDLELAAQGLRLPRGEAREALAHYRDRVAPLGHHDPVALERARLAGHGLADELGRLLELDVLGRGEVRRQGEVLEGAPDVAGDGDERGERRGEVVVGLGGEALRGGDRRLELRAEGLVVEAQVPHGLAELLVGDRRLARLLDRALEERAERAGPEPDADPDQDLPRALGEVGELAADPADRVADLVVALEADPNVAGHQRPPG